MGSGKELFVIDPAVETPLAPGADVAIRLARSGVSVVPQG